jgi:hypothetical protein
MLDDTHTIMQSCFEVRYNILCTQDVTDVPGDLTSHVRTAGGMTSTIGTSIELEGFRNACDVDFNTTRISLIMYREQPMRPYNL